MEKFDILGNRLFYFLAESDEKIETTLLQAAAG